MKDDISAPANMQDQQQAMLRRLARIEGQIRGIQAMIKRGEDCESIAQQFPPHAARWTRPIDCCSPVCSKKPCRTRSRTLPKP